MNPHQNAGKSILGNPENNISGFPLTIASYCRAGRLNIPSRTFHHLAVHFSTLFALVDESLLSKVPLY